MMDEKYQFKIDRGQKAADRLDDDFLNQCFNDITTGLIAIFLKSPVGPVGLEMRERARVLVDALDLLKDLLGQYKRDGKVAQADLEKLISLN